MKSDVIKGRHSAARLRAVPMQDMVLPFVWALLLLALMGCSRPPEMIGVDNPAVPAASVNDVTHHRIFITTTRTPSAKPGAFLSEKRAEDLGLASVDVTIPPTHVIGQIERPTSLPPDPRRDFTAVAPVTYASAAKIVAEINRELARRPVGKRTVLLFVHGYNNTPSDALLRIAQFVHDAKFEGVPVLLTWASAAKTSRYVYDLNSALIARGKIKEIAAILGQTKATSVDVFAHSMGTFLTMEGLVDLQLSGELGRRGTLNHIMLAAPDIDIDLFRSQLAQLSPKIREKIYILASNDDNALRFSSKIAGGVPRVGDSDPLQLEQLGVTVIDLSQIDDSSSGSHSKFAGSPAVVQLIGAGLGNVGTFGEQNSSVIEKILAVSPIHIFRK